jgi:hypothetical protein
MSELQVNKISPQSGTSITLGDSGDTFTIPSGATFTNNGTATGFGFSISGASAYPDGTQSMPDNTFTKVDLEVEDFDTDNEFSNSRFTASAAGKYLVSGAVFENENGTRFLDGGQTTDYAVNYTFNVPTTAITLAQNDYLELFYFHNKGSSLDINGLSGSIRTTHLTVLRII